jgi:hypothetical protein
MELKSLVNYKLANNSLKLIAIISIIFSLLFSGFVYFFSWKKLQESKQTVYILDATGKAYLANEKGLDVNTRIFEYESHVKYFYKLWYEFDQFSYQRNIDEALYLVGDCGRELYNEYKEQDLLNILKSKNINTSVQIKNVKIDITKTPVTGYIKGIQTITRLGGLQKRNMDCTFDIQDIDRSRENPHGCIIENWKVVDNNPVSDTTNTGN